MTKNPSDPTKAMLLCALHRHGKPATNAILHDGAIGLMQAEGWPRRRWAGLTAQGVSLLLRKMVDDGLLVRKDIPVNGRLTPQFDIPGGAYDASAKPPPVPDADGEDHPLHGMTRRQQYVLFDCQDALLSMMGRQIDETNAMVQRHLRELGTMVDRSRSQLVAAGLEEVAR